MSLQGNSSNSSIVIDNDTYLWEHAERTVHPNIVDLYMKNRRVTDRAFYILIAAYSLLICVGVFGNVLVVSVVLRKPAMRTARNLFILNLAISDLLLCLITMPLTLMEILTRYWPLGENVFACKLIAVSQATSIFVSTLSITAIALDRYQLIVNPTRSSLHLAGALITIAVIWTLSLLFAGPLYFIKRLEFPHDAGIIQEHLQLDMLAFCIEDWPFSHGRGIYSGVCLVLQYLLPIFTVSIAYSQICRKLQYRQAAARSSTSRRRTHDNRRRRTNSLLIAISLIYCLSWLPLNVFNLVMDFTTDSVFGEDHNAMMIVYAVCHMAGMSSACSNPLLYGWLNDNFRKEFKEILQIFWHLPVRDGTPRWLESFRSSISKARSKNRSSSCSEKIGMREKTGKEEGSVPMYVDSLGKKIEDRGHQHFNKTNVTMTTSLDDGCEFIDDCTEAQEEESRSQGESAVDSQAIAL